VRACEQEQEREQDCTDKEAGSERAAHGQDLAGRYSEVGRLFHHSRQKQASEENYCEALRLWKGLETPQVHWQLLEGPRVFNPCDAIRTRIGLASLYCQWARYADALSAAEEALVVVFRERESSMDISELQGMLAEILAVKGRVCLEEEQGRREEAQPLSASSTNGGCCQALALFEEALEIHHSLHLQEGLIKSLHQMLLRFSKCSSSLSAYTHGRKVACASVVERAHTPMNAGICNKHYTSQIHMAVSKCAYLLRISSGRGGGETGAHSGRAFGHS